MAVQLPSNKTLISVLQCTQDVFLFVFLLNVVGTRENENVLLSVHNIYFERATRNDFFVYILNKSENATLQLSIFYEKVLDKKYLIKLNNVAQTSRKRFVETPPICLIERICKILKIISLWQKQIGNIKCLVIFDFSQFSIFFFCQIK